MNSVTGLVTLLTVCVLFGRGDDGDCTSNGFFRHPEDCTRFYRCVDLTGKGYFKKYTFSCPVGTVFDETVSVCNHPWAAPPCEEKEEEEVEEEIEESDEDDSISTVIVTPTFSYECS